MAQFDDVVFSSWFLFDLTVINCHWWCLRLQVWDSHQRCINLCWRPFLHRQPGRAAGFLVAGFWVFPKIRDIPKWVVKIMEIPYKNGWFGGKTHYFWKHPYFRVKMISLSIFHGKPWAFGHWGWSSNLHRGSYNEYIIAYAYNTYIFLDHPGWHRKTIGDHPQ